MDELVFNVRNAKKTAAVFIANDPAFNAVTLIVNNATDSDLRLRAGAPVAEPPPDDGPTRKPWHCEPSRRRLTHSSHRLRERRSGAPKRMAA